jgi:hypothetical protein
MINLIVAIAQIGGYCWNRDAHAPMYHFGIVVFNFRFHPSGYQPFSCINYQDFLVFCTNLAILVLTWTAWEPTRPSPPAGMVSLVRA